MGNSLSDNSYLNTYLCGARNITWQYIHTFGIVPHEFTLCPSYSAILSSHCCWDGICTPHPWFDPEFHRYQWKNWNGLGDPYLNRTWPYTLDDDYDVSDLKRIGTRSKDRRKNQTQYAWTCQPFFYGGWDFGAKVWVMDGPEARRAKEICTECFENFLPNDEKNVSWVEVRRTWDKSRNQNCTDACEKVQAKDLDALVLVKNENITASGLLNVFTNKKWNLE